MQNPETELVLDDRHPSIKYVSGDWGQGGTKKEYRSTTTYTQKTGALAIVDFYGESIRVLATLDLKERYSVPANTTLDVSFVIQDTSGNIVVPSTTTSLDQAGRPEYNVQLYKASQLNKDQKLQLIIKNETPNDYGFLCLDAVYIGGSYAMGGNNTATASTELKHANKSLLIITVVLGILVGLLVIAILCLWYFSRRGKVLVQKQKRSSIHLFSVDPQTSIIAEGLVTPATHLLGRPAPERRKQRDHIPATAYCDGEGANVILSSSSGQTGRVTVSENSAMGRQDRGLGTSSGRTTQSPDEQLLGPPPYAILS